MVRIMIGLHASAEGPITLPPDPAPHGAARLHEAREAVLPDAFLLQAAEETLKDPVLLWSVGLARSGFG
jgi:hypothetical protein